VLRGPWRWLAARARWTTWWNPHQSTAEAAPGTVPTGLPTGGTSLRSYQQEPGEGEVPLGASPSHFFAGRVHGVAARVVRVSPLCWTGGARPGRVPRPDR